MMKLKKMSKVIVTIAAIVGVVMANSTIHADAATYNETKSTINVTSADVRYTLNIDESQSNAVQNFYIDNMIYTTQRITDKYNYVLVSEWRKSGNSTILNSQMWIKEAGHGQTLEVYSYKDPKDKVEKTFLLFSLKSNEVYNPKTDKDDVWSIQIGRVPYEPCTKENAISYKSCSRFSALTYANDTSTDFGEIKRVDAALSSDKSTMLIWKRNTDNENEMTAYDFNVFNKQLDSVTSDKPYVSFENNKTMKKAVKFSFNDVKSSKSIPTSMQGIEISNEVDNIYSIYIASGTEKSGGVLKIYRFNSNGTKKAERTITHTGFLTDDKLEIEGIHISGSTLQFLLVRASLEGQKVDKTQQYIMQINKTFLK